MFSRLKNAARSIIVGRGSEFIVTLPVLAEQPTASAQTA
jgi:hypothetical protein